MRAVDLNFLERFCRGRGGKKKKKTFVTNIPRRRMNPEEGLMVISYGILVECVKNIRGRGKAFSIGNDQLVGPKIPPVERYWSHQLMGPTSKVHH